MLIYTWKSQEQKLGKKKNKSHPNRKGRQNYLFAGEMILYTENPKGPIKKLLDQHIQ